MGQCFCNILKYNLEKTFGTYFLFPRSSLLTALPTKGLNWKHWATGNIQKHTKVDGHGKQQKTSTLFKVIFNVRGSNVKHED